MLYHYVHSKHRPTHTKCLSKQNLLEKAVICNPFTMFTFSFRLNNKKVDLRKARFTSKQVQYLAYRWYIYSCMKNEKVSLFCNVPKIKKYLNIEECHWAKVYGKRDIYRYYNSKYSI